MLLSHIIRNLFVSVFAVSVFAVSSLPLITVVLGQLGYTDQAFWAGMAFVKIMGWN